MAEDFSENFQINSINRLTNFIKKKFSYSHIIYSQHFHKNKLGTINKESKPKQKTKRIDAYNCGKKIFKENHSGLKEKV